MNPDNLLRSRAKELLNSKQVRVVLGWTASPGSPVSTPLFARTEEDADRLKVDETCSLNLANYLLRFKDEERVAIVARGCESRSIVVLIQENQLRREQVYILGKGCTGVFVQGVKSPSCAQCRYPNPVIYDEMLGDPVEPAEPDPALTQADAEFDRLSQNERWEIVSADISRCIRCYACRQVCPNCYCPVCFVDASNPQLVGKTHNLSDNMVFHIIRALHMAGRCVECGACHRACPMGIDLMRFNRRVCRIVQEKFNAVSGVDLNNPPALTRFAPDDPQEFIK
uniref:4Fe-4S ferredoxin n=1 Tax=candidate division WOR-3 bacterium TaxID=2052148 RepID=A0A7V3UZG9_UNCW3